MPPFLQLGCLPSPFACLAKPSSPLPDPLGMHAGVFSLRMALPALPPPPFISHAPRMQVVHYGRHCCGALQWGLRDGQEGQCAQVRGGSVGQWRRKMTDFSQAQGRLSDPGVLSPHTRIHLLPHTKGQAPSPVPFCLVQLASVPCFCYHSPYCYRSTHPPPLSTSAGVCDCR